MENDFRTRRASALEELLMTRKSVRAFRPDCVPQELLDTALRMARWAPSNCNTQPWEVHLVSGATAERLRGELMRDYTAGNSAPDMPYLMAEYTPVIRDRQIKHTIRQRATLGVAREDKETMVKSNMSFWNAPNVAFLFMPAFGNEREAADVGGFAQSFMLACTAMGLGTCPQTSLGMMAATVKRVLGVSGESKLLFGIAIGFPDEEHRAVRIEQDRLELGEFVTYHC